jgi:hypothetical protein
MSKRLGGGDENGFQLLMLWDLLSATWIYPEYACSQPEVFKIRKYACI